MPTKGPHNYRNLTDLISKAFTEDVPTAHVFKHLKKVEKAFFPCKIGDTEIKALHQPKSIFRKSALGGIVDPQQILDLSQEHDWQELQKELNAPVNYSARKILAFMQSLGEAGIAEATTDLLDGRPVRPVPGVYVDVARQDFRNSISYGMVYNLDQDPCFIELLVDLDNRFKELNFYLDQGQRNTRVQLFFDGKGYVHSSKIEL